MDGPLAFVPPPDAAAGLGFVGLAFLAALLVSGVIGRTIRQTKAATGAVVADAGFGLSQVHLSGNNRVPPETLLAALGYNLGESIFAVDLRAARERLMALDWVADADVQRRYPDSINVHIVEKLPFAALEIAGRCRGRGALRQDDHAQGCRDVRAAAASRR